jgi:predicted Zn-ribbon and HTH transcriptional regulator
MLEHEGTRAMKRRGWVMLSFMRPWSGAVAHKGHATGFVPRRFGADAHKGYATALARPILNAILMPSVSPAKHRNRGILQLSSYETGAAMNTVRQQIISLLSQDNHGAKSISKIIRISEKEVYEHLEHIGRSVRSHDRKLRIIPAICLQCGFVFDDRNRFTSPGKCPKCKGEHIQDPGYCIEGP